MKKKILALCLVVVLAVTAVTGVTLAYFTDESEVVTNTFTVGDIEITLDEAKTGEDGTAPDHDDRVTENTYTDLYPGQELDKDPTVTVKANSEECYVRMHVQVKDYSQLAEAFPVDDEDFDDYWVGDVFLLQNLVGDTWDSETWLAKGFKKDTTDTYEFWYNGTVAEATSDTVLDDLFEKIYLPGEMTNAQIAALENIQIVVSADAIQAAGFDNQDAAWAAFDAEVTEDPGAIAGV